MCLMQESLSPMRRAQAAKQEEERKQGHITS